MYEWFYDYYKFVQLCNNKYVKKLYVMGISACVWYAQLYNTLGQWVTNLQLDSHVNEKIRFSNYFFFSCKQCSIS